LEFQTSSLVTGGLNSHLHYGRASVLFYPSLTLLQHDFFGIF
jgi:hypothetical protein